MAPPYEFSLRAPKNIFPDALQQIREQWGRTPYEFDAYYSLVTRLSLQALSGDPRAQGFLRHPPFQPDGEAGEVFVSAQSDYRSAEALGYFTRRVPGEGILKHTR